MAKFTVNLNRGTVACKACGYIKPDSLPNPCPRCKCGCNIVEYKRGNKFVRYDSHGRNPIDVSDFDAEMRAAIDALWRKEQRMYELCEYSDKFIEKKKLEFYSVRGISL